jgi:hypothetical protein
MIALPESKGSNERANGSPCIELGKRVLEFRKSPSAAGSGYLGYVELYLDGEYEGYVGIPKLGGPQVMIYGRSQVPEVRDSDELGREGIDDKPTASNSASGPCNRKASHTRGITRLLEGFRNRQGS